MTFDFKITTWERVTVLEGQEAEVLEEIKAGKITSAGDILEIFADAEIKGMADSDEQMQVEDNGGFATIEVEENSINIYQNGK